MRRGPSSSEGHKVLALPQENGKLTAEAIRHRCALHWEDGNRDHMVEPGMVYLSQPTEYGTLYSLAELEEIAAVCRAYDIPLYADGARLAYALACPENDVTLPDLARLCDVFYIGGTKCGALMGEAVVARDPARLPRFFTIMKQHGALLAKGWLLGLQFDALFTDGLYEKDLGLPAIQGAGRGPASRRGAGYTPGPGVDAPTSRSSWSWRTAPWTGWRRRWSSASSRPMMRLTPSFAWPPTGLPGWRMWKNWAGLWQAPRSNEGKRAWAQNALCQGPFVRFLCPFIPQP